MGGTFDPVHLGHLRLAEEARMCLDLEQVRWIPAGSPPHRASPSVTATDRLEMVRLAVARNPHFVVDVSEALSRQPSYTVVTLERLRAELGPDRPLVLLLGADAFAGLTSWHRWQELFNLSHIAVATRPGFNLAKAASIPALSSELVSRQRAQPAAIRQRPAGFIVPFTMTSLSISASMLRAEIAAGRSARYLVPDAVLAYIETKGLYLPHGR